MQRIYTEDINRESIVRILAGLFTGYTVIPTIGRWKGCNEQSLVIEFFDANPLDVIKAAERIKAENKQDAVMVASIPNINPVFV
jgi:hypothetical protein